MEKLECSKCQSEVTSSGECQCMEALSIEGSAYYRLFLSDLKEVMRVCIWTGVPNPSQLLHQNVPANTLRNRAFEAFMKDPHRRISHVSFCANGVAISVTCLFNGQDLHHFSAEEELSTIISGQSYTLPVRILFWGLDSTDNRAIQIVGNNLNWQQIVADIESNTAHLAFRIYDMQDDGDDHNWVYRIDEDGSAVQVRGNPPAAKNEVKNLKTQTVVNDTEFLCPVCQEKMLGGQIMKKMPCNHEYHEECIDQWLAYSNFCPLCKHELPTDDPDYEQKKRQRTP